MNVPSQELTHGMERNNKRPSGVSKQIHRKTVTGFLRKLAVGPYGTFGSYSLLVLFVGGLAGVLLDLDHLVIRQTQMVRPFHLPIWIGLCAGTIGYYAYLHRRVHQLGVKKKNDS